MSLIEEYYELNEAEEVSSVWKTLQIGFYVCAACLGLWCGYTLAILRLRFEDRCYLFTEVKTLKEDRIDQSNINWESDMWCDYYQFSMVSSFIVAIIWATFFLMCGKGGKSLTGFVLDGSLNNIMRQREIRPLCISGKGAPSEKLSRCHHVLDPLSNVKHNIQEKNSSRGTACRLPQPWRIVWSSLIFNFLYFLIALSTAINIQQGTDYFCERHNLDKKATKIPIEEQCAPLKFLLKKDVYITSVQLEIVVKTSWGCAVSWVILFLLSLLRIVFVIDFHMYKICVFRIDDTIQNKQEEVLRITNYEEPRQLPFGRDENRRVYYTSSEDNLEDLEAGNRKKTKVDKKSMRQYFNAASRSPLQTNAAFYIVADLGMLTRDRKKKQISRVLNEAFPKSRFHLVPELRMSTKFQSHPPESDAYRNSAYLYTYSQEFYGEGDEDEIGLYSTYRHQELTEDWNDGSDSESEISLASIQSNNSLRIKKRI